MVIFHSYVSLPEGNLEKTKCSFLVLNYLHIFARSRKKNAKPCQTAAKDDLFDPYEYVPALGVPHLLVNPWPVARSPRKWGRVSGWPVGRHGIGACFITIKISK